MQDFSNIPQMETIKECSKLTGLSYWCIAKMVKEKKVKYIKSGNRTYINFGSLCAFLGNTENEQEQENT